MVDVVGEDLKTPIFWYGRGKRDANGHHFYGILSYSGRRYVANSKPHKVAA
jgi:hypothetical protein